MLEANASKRQIFSAVDRKYKLEKSYKGKIKRTIGKIKVISEIIRRLDKIKEERNKKILPNKSLIEKKRSSKKEFEYSKSINDISNNNDIDNLINKNHNSNVAKTKIGKRIYDKENEKLMIKKGEERLNELDQINDFNINSENEFIKNNKNRKNNYNNLNEDDDPNESYFKKYFNQEEILKDIREEKEKSDEVLKLNKINKNVIDDENDYKNIQKDKKNSFDKVLKLNKINKNVIDDVNDDKNIPKENANNDLNNNDIDDNGSIKIRFFKKNPQTRFERENYEIINNIDFSDITKSNPNLYLGESGFDLLEKTNNLLNPNHKGKITFNKPNPDPDIKIKNLIIENVNDIFFEAKEQGKQGKKYLKIFEIKERNYHFYDRYHKIECFKLFIINPRSIFDKNSRVRIFFKSLTIYLLFIFLWCYFAIFIQGIYELYGDNIIYICLSPLISIILFKLLITANFKILVTTAYLYYFGNYYINRRRHGICQKIALRIFASPIAYKYYQALVMFKQYMYWY